MDEATVWNVAFDLTDVQELYNSGCPGDPTKHSESSGLVSWWKMGDGDTYSTLSDSKGSNDLTMTNMASTDIKDYVPCDIFSSSSSTT